SGAGVLSGRGRPSEVRTRSSDWGNPASGPDAAVRHGTEFHRNPLTTQNRASRSEAGVRPTRCFQSIPQHHLFLLECLPLEMELYETESGGVLWNILAGARRLRKRRAGCGISSSRN